MGWFEYFNVRQCGLLRHTFGDNLEIEIFFLFSEVEISQNFRRKSQNANILLQNKDQSHQKNPEALVLVEAWKILTNFTKWPRPHPPKNLGKVMPAKEKKGNYKKKSPKAQILTMRAFWIYLQIDF